MDKLIGVLIAVTLLCIINTAPCQAMPMSPIEKELRQNLTKLVSFVVDPTANISEDLVNFAFASGGSPRTQRERMMYIDMLEKIARNTPNFMKNFTTTTTLPDGTTTETIDEIGIRSHLIRRGTEYEHSKKGERERAAAADAIVAAAMNNVRNQNNNLNANVHSNSIFSNFIANLQNNNANLNANNNTFNTNANVQQPNLFDMFANNNQGGFLF